MHSLCIYSRKRIYVPGTVPSTAYQSLRGDGSGGEGGTAKGHKETFRDSDYFHKLDVVMASRVYAYFKPCQIIHVKYVPFNVCQANLSTAVKK